MNDSPRQPFATTQWTLVWRAAAEESGYGKPALGEIVRRYWHPLYSFARQHGLSPPDAEDATQEFLSGILDGDLLAKADPAKGRFRTYLLTAWKRFLIDQYRKSERQRRGGSMQSWSLDVAEGEQAWQSVIGSVGPQGQADSDQAFMLAWANDVLDEVRRRVLADYRARSREPLFQALSEHLTRPADNKDYERLSKALAMQPSAVKVALHRLRQRFGETLRQVIQETVDDSNEVDQEIAELLEVLRRT